VDPFYVAAATAYDNLREAKEAGFEFLQKELSHHLVVEARNTIAYAYNKLNLGACLSFCQIFTAMHLDEINKVSTTLRGRCNTGTATSDEKSMYLSLFEIWLIHNGIANLLSVAQLELDGFRLMYAVCTTWYIYCPDGTVLKLKRNKGLCECSPYLDIQEHKAIVAMVQTVRQTLRGVHKASSARGYPGV